MAPAGRLFKRGPLVALAAAMTIGGIPGRAAAQAPDEDWRTIHTEHFRVTFPAGIEELGRKAADRAEWAWRELSTHLVDPPDDLIDLLVTDHTDISNGFAQVTPGNRITVFARPPVDALSIAHVDEWMELVILHELAHIVQLDHVDNPIGSVARAVFGRVSMEWPFFPELGTPRWLTEGLATWYESRLTQAGRVRGTFEEMQIRTAVLEGRFENIGQASGASPLWPGGNRPYAYGSLFFDFLLARHGEDRMAVFVDAIAGQWIPYRLDSAGRDAFGVSLTDEWKAWEAELETELAGLDAALERVAPITEAVRLTTDARWALYPQVSPDGRWLAHTRSDGRSDTQIRLRDLETGEVRSLGRTNGLSTFSWMPDGRLLLSQVEFDDPYRLYADLWILDPAGGEDRLTRAARLTQPAAASDGRTALAIQEGDGINSIVRVDLSTGDVTPVVAPDPEVLWAFPRPSPDGRWIAATRWEPNANHDLVLIDGQTGAVVTRLTSDRALDTSPSWTPDSRSLVWTSDRSGIFNVLIADIDPETGRASVPRIVTNVRTGAAYPSVDPTGQWLYFSGYHVDGWDVERIPFGRGDGAPARAAVTRFDSDGTQPVRGLADQPLQEYSAASTLGPTYWEIAYRDPVEAPAIEGQGLFLRRRELLGFGIGAQSSGYDLVGRHAWSAVGRVTTSGGKVEGGASYSYLGFGNPVLSISARQVHADGGQQVAGDAQDTLFVLQRDRAVEGSVSFRTPTWRRDLLFTLGVEHVWENRELLNVKLAPARAYTLNRPTSQLVNVRLAASYNSSRSHSFQMGTTRGINLFLQGRVRSEYSLPDSLASVAGLDRSLGEVIGRARGSLPLWGNGRTVHVLALQASGGVAAGPGAGALQYRVGGASGRLEPLTGLELFGGNFILMPVRGYDTSSRFGRYAWSASAEYRFPLWIVNRGLRAWPLHLDRAIGAVFFDAGNAWGPDVTPEGFRNPLRTALASAGAEVTTQILGLYDVQMRIRLGGAIPLVEGSGIRGYVRVGLPF